MCWLVQNNYAIGYEAIRERIVAKIEGRGEGKGGKGFRMGEVVEISRTGHNKLVSCIVCFHLGMSFDLP